MNADHSADGAGEDKDSGAALVERVRALVPALRERGRGAEEQGRIPDQTIDELAEAGIFRAVVPRRYGGLEVDFRDIANVVRELARGCASTAWAMGLLMFDGFQIAHFPARFQDEAWGPDGAALVAGQVMPSGSAKPVDGGDGDHGGIGAGIAFTLRERPVIAR